eukprot:TRINITY_DN8569_c1_g1_i1.p1 TRINITY_DN8569_c1_g1~~TRINITY_DN8569_c1_g1_i1.p1  ORF type:complete len:1060 (+),score=265.23 TRINITY_DN8569_c1_g1_i1:51-3182(+)
MMTLTSMRRWWAGEGKGDEKDETDDKGPDPFMVDATNGNVASVTENDDDKDDKEEHEDDHSQHEDEEGDMAVDEASTAVSEKQEPPAGRRRWFPSISWKRGKKQEEPEEEITDQASLSLLLKMQGKEGIFKALNGQWVTSKGTLVSVNKTEVQYAGEKNPVTLKITNLTVALSNCEIDLAKSNQKLLLWTDSDTWKRQSVTESEKATRAEEWMDRTTTPLSAIPLAMKVTCYEQPDIEGTYILMEDIHNEMPAWQYRRQRLYNGPGGYWMFSTAVKMSQNLGVVSSKNPHNGTFPDLIQSWEYYGGAPGMKDGWAQCSLISIIRVDDDDGNVLKTARKPLNGTVRNQTTSSPLTEEGINFRLEVFFNELDIIQPQHVISDLAARVITKKATIDRVMSALCKKFSLPESDWKGRQCIGVMKYILEQLYEQYDERHLSKVDSLLEDITDGRFPFDTAVQKLCEKWRSKGAIYDDWVGEYPVALRDGYDAATSSMKLRKKSEAPSPDMGEEVIIERAPTESLKMDWKDHNLLLGVQEGGVGAKYNLDRFIGYRLISVNNKIITKWNELKAAVDKQSTLKLVFYRKHRPEVRPGLRKPTLSSISRESSLQTLNTSSRRSTMRKERHGSSLSHTLPAATEGGVCVDRLTATQYGEAAGRSEIVQDETSTRVAKLLPGKAALTVGIIAHSHKSWVRIRQAIMDTADTAEPPPKDLVDKMDHIAGSLKVSIQHAERAFKVCTIPAGLRKMVDMTNMTIVRYEDLHSDVLNLKDEQSTLKKEIDALNATIKETLQNAGEDPTDDGLKATVAELNGRLIEKETQRSDVIASYLSMCAGDPVMAWVPVAEKKREERRKSKKEKKDKKAKKRSRVPSPALVDPLPEEEGAMDAVEGEGSDDEPGSGYAFPSMPPPQPPVEEAEVEVEVSKGPAVHNDPEEEGEMIPDDDQEDAKDEFETGPPPPPEGGVADVNDTPAVEAATVENEVAGQEEEQGVEAENKPKKDKKSKKEKKAKKAAKRAKEQADREALENEQAGEQQKGQLQEQDSEDELPS